MMTKMELDSLVATSVGIPVRKVAKITDAFIDELCNAVTYHGGFNLAKLGKLATKIETQGGGCANENYPNAARIKLYFKKSKTLKTQIELAFGLREPSYAKER